MSALSALSQFAESEGRQSLREEAIALIRAIAIGDEAAKLRAYQRLQRIWTQGELDDFTISVEALFRLDAG
ncbi:MAG: hypothetical protein HY710_00800 [Candidatus Latescibacteria bacterium]|nr:hypothetical protein [Candidatus Latescibacterota bacterium]